MSKKYKKHGYAERLKYMHMLENGFSQNYIEKHFGINHRVLDKRVMPDNRVTLGEEKSEAES